MKAALARLRGGGDRDAEAGRGGGGGPNSGHQRLANAQRVLADPVSPLPVGFSLAVNKSVLHGWKWDRMREREREKKRESTIVDDP